MKKLTALLLAALLVLGAVCALADAYPCGATITTTSVNLRNGPSTSTRSLDQLTMGERVTVLSEAVPVADTWYYVRTQEGLHGYVHESLIRVDDAAADYASGTPSGRAYSAFSLIENRLYASNSIYSVQLVPVTAEPDVYGDMACISVTCYVNDALFGSFLITATGDGVLLSGFEIDGASFDANPYWIYDWNGQLQRSLEVIPFEQWVIRVMKTPNSGSVNTLPGYSGAADAGLYGLTIDKLSTRTGPGTSYDDAGTYNVKGQWIRVLARAWSDANNIWWVKVEIPHGGEIRTLWTGYKRFDSNTLPLDSIPVEYW